MHPYISQLVAIERGRDMRAQAAAMRRARVAGGRHRGAVRGLLRRAGTPRAGSPAAVAPGAAVAARP
jgi:hypothetical protein